MYICPCYTAKVKFFFYSALGPRPSDQWRSEGGGPPRATIRRGNKKGGKNWGW